MVHIVKVDRKVFLIIQLFADVDYSVSSKPLFIAGLTPSMLEKRLQSISPSAVSRIIWYTHECPLAGDNKCELGISRLCKHGKASCEDKICPVQSR